MLLAVVIYWALIGLTKATSKPWPAISAHLDRLDHLLIGHAPSSVWAPNASSWGAQAISVAASSEDLFSRPYAFSSLKKFEGLDPSSLLGGRVMFFGGYVAVSAVGHDAFEGLVHIYRPINMDTWTAVFTISSPQPDLQAFGSALASFDRSLLIAAVGFAYYTGRVFLYHHRDEEWALNTTFVSPLGLGEQFGRSLAMSNDTLLIGSEENVFVYHLSHGVWVLMQELSDPLASADIVPGILPASSSAASAVPSFGHAVCLHGSYAAVSSLQDGGVVHIYQQVLGLWELSQTLLPVNSTGMVFGMTVVLSESHLLIGQVGSSIALDDEVGLLGAGAFPSGRVLVFNLQLMPSSNLTVWQQSAVIPSPMDGDFSFGRSVDVHGDTMVIGTALFPNSGEGSAFTFSRQDTLPSASATNDSLASVLLLNQTIILQSEQAYNVIYGVQDDGNVTVVLDSNLTASWALNQTFASPAGTEGYFGISVAVSDTFVAIGADGFNAIQGVLYLGSLLPRPTHAPSSSPTSRPTTVQPTSTPTSSPTASPTMRPTQDSAAAGAGEGVTASQSVQDSAKSIIIIIIIIAIIIAAIITTIIICCCCLCRRVPVAADKKKKKEEEDSPYTVHGPLDELDKQTLPDYGPGELITPQPMPMPLVWYPYPMPWVLYPMPPVMPWAMDKKDIKGDPRVPGDQPGAYFVNHGHGRVLRYWNHAIPRDVRQSTDKEDGGLLGEGSVQGTAVDWHPPPPWGMYPPYGFIDQDVFSPQDVSFVDPLFDPRYVREILQGPLPDPAAGPSMVEASTWTRVLHEQRLCEEEARRTQTAHVHRLRSVESTDSLPSIELSAGSLDDAERGVCEKTKTLVEQAKDRRRLLNLRSWKRPPLAPRAAPSHAPAVTGGEQRDASCTLDDFMAMQDEDQMQEELLQDQVLETYQQRDNEQGADPLPSLRRWTRPPVPVAPALRSAPLPPAAVAPPPPAATSFPLDTFMTMQDEDQLQEEQLQEQVLQQQQREREHDQGADPLLPLRRWTRPQLAPALRPAPLAPVATVSGDVQGISQQERFARTLEASMTMQDEDQRQEEQLQEQVLQAYQQRDQEQGTDPLPSLRRWMRPPVAPVMHPVAPPSPPPAATSFPLDVYMIMQDEDQRQEEQLQDQVFQQQEREQDGDQMLPLKHWRRPPLAAALHHSPLPPALLPVAAVGFPLNNFMTKQDDDQLEEDQLQNQVLEAYQQQERDHDQGQDDRLLLLRRWTRPPVAPVLRPASLPPAVVAPPPPAVARFPLDVFMAMQDEDQLQEEQLQEQVLETYQLQQREQEQDGNEDAT